MTGPLALYDSRLNDGTPSASSTAAGYDVLNLRDLRPYSFWKPTALPATVTVDCGSSKSADFLAVYGHDLHTQGCTIEVHTSTDNFAANDVTVDTTAPADDKPLLRLFASASSRYWRIKVLNGSAPTLAIALLGSRLEVPAGVREGFDPLGRNIKAQYNRSVSGYPLGRVVNFREWKETATFELLSWAWVRSTWQPAAESYLEPEPWLFAWDPDGHPAETYLVNIDGQWNVPHQAGSLCNLQVPLLGIIPS